jgi:hypothetical protein
MAGIKHGGDIAKGVSRASAWSHENQIAPVSGEVSEQ